MEKINIAELLKDCPKGMELYSPIFGTIYFNGVKNTGNSILIEVSTVCNSICHFYPDGKYNTYYSESECLLFPSKDQRDWSKFQRSFKDGDIVASERGNWIGITTGGKKRCFMPTYCIIKGSGEFEVYFDKKGLWVFSRLATEKEKERLFKAIKENGYKWNAETKTLEKLSKFKVGDIVRSKNCPEANNFIIVDVKENGYSINLKDYYIEFKDQDNYELVPDKFDITTLKPFDKVLVRGKIGQKWTHDFFGFIDKDKGYPFVCVGCYVIQCIPYEGNEHLLGTTNDCSEYYKTWE